MSEKGEKKKQIFNVQLLTVRTPYIKYYRADIKPVRRNSGTPQELLVGLFCVFFIIVCVFIGENVNGACGVKHVPLYASVLNF